MTRDKKTRILSIMLGTGAGGLESVALDHARAFTKLGYHSALLCHQKSAVLPRLTPGDQVIPYTTPSASLFSPLAWHAVARTIRTEKPDIICLHGNRAISFCTSPVMKALIHPFPKLMATTHNNRNKRFYRLDGIFAISQTLKNDLVKRFHIDANKIFTCPNAAGTPRDIPASSPKPPVKIGFLGRLEPVKGCDILLDACLRLKKAHIPFHLVVAGDGSQRPAYQEFVAQNKMEKDVSFIGWTNDKAQFFSSVDIVSIPSRSEAQSLTLLESLSYGKPVVISACPGMMEVISPLAAGLSFPTDDATELFGQLKTLIQNPDVCTELSRRARQTYQKYYTPTTQQKNLANGIESLLHQSRHTR